MKFNTLYESVKSKLSKQFPKIQTDFSQEISDGWNLLLKRDDSKDDIIPFVLYDNTSNKYTGSIRIIGEDFEVEWESDKPLESEGMIGSETLYGSLKQMVELIKDSNKG